MTPTALREGDPAPDFTLTSDSGDAITLSSLRGSPVILYFYPKDDTPGCTRQACGFRDLYEEFEERGAVVLGVSTDDAETHRKFKAKYALPFALLADTEHEAADAYGVWGERTYRGRSYTGVNRSTFVVDAGGRISSAMYGVKPDDNPSEVLDALGGR